MRAAQEREFVDFVRDASPRLLTTAWMLTGDPHQAEELVQEALARVYVRWPKVRTGTPLAYTRRVVTNLHTDHWRKHRREVLVDQTPELTDPRASSQHVDLIRALQALPERQRQVVVLRHYLDRSEQQTADTLDIGVGTVKSATSRGLARLRTLMDGDESHVTV